MTTTPGDAKQASGKGRREINVKLRLVYGGEGSRAESRAGGKQGGKLLGSQLKVPTKSHKSGYIAEPVTFLVNYFGVYFSFFVFFPPTPKFILPVVVADRIRIYNSYLRL